MQLEICCGDLASVIAARKGGASRIELCSGLTDGGLTPSMGLIRGAVATGIPHVNVLIRPRPGDFLYSPEELDLMEDDIRGAIAAGANGVVIGVLTPEGEIDTEACTRLIEAAHDQARKENKEKADITFHRAFDVSDDPDKSLEAVISLGCDSLLTSGMAPSAMKGIPMLSHLVHKADGRVAIMAGAGINPANAADIIKATSVNAIHSTARKPIASRMCFRRPLVPMGAPGSDEYAPLSTSPDVVAALIECINTK